MDSNVNENDSMKDLMDEAVKSMKKIKQGDIVKGKVISADNGEVYVNIGYMSDGIISKEEIAPDENFNAGDEISVYVLKTNDGEGNVALSKIKADRKIELDKLEKSYKEKETLKAHVKNAVKGGVIAEVNGVSAFIPASQLSVSYVKDLKEFEGKDIEVRVIEFNPHKNKIILSRKEIEEEELEKKKAELWESLQKGEKRSGVVKKLTRFGAFVDLGGIDGLVHISDLSWERVKSPEEVVKVGDNVEVFVLDFDKEKNRISLALKDINNDPMDKALEKYKVNDIADGKVVKIVDFGAFVELEPGVEGLVHISEISDSRVDKVSDVLKVGQNVKVKILNIKDKKISLSIKEAAFKEDIKKYSNDNDDEGSGVTIGDVLKDQLKGFKFE